MSLAIIPATPSADHPVLCQMQRMAANLDPATARAAGIDPAQLEFAREQMKNLSPEEMERMAAQVIICNCFSQLWLNENVTRNNVLLEALPISQKSTPRRARGAGEGHEP